MKKVKRWRYYCDYCKKSGGSRYHIEKHEKSCTANPDRKCGLCEIGCLDQKTNAELTEFMRKYIRSNCIIDAQDDLESRWQEIKPEFEEKEVLEALRKFVEGCPACMLAAMRYTESTSCFNSFKWKEERDLFFKENTPEQGYYY